MEIKKIFGYILSALGIIFLVASMSEKIALSIPLIENISADYFLPAGIALIVVGVLLLFNKKMSKIKNIEELEVPIYKGKSIVGYRRSN